MVLHDHAGHPSLSTTHRGDQHLRLGVPQLLQSYEQATDIAQLDCLVVDREGMAAEFLFQRHGAGRRVVTLLRSNHYEEEGSFTGVGEWVPWRSDRSGKVVGEVAAARFQLARSTQPDQPLAVRVALIRDWRKQVICEAGTEAQTDGSEQWKADFAPDQQNFWEPDWQATPARPAPTRPKLIPVVRTAAEADAVELAQRYFRQWIWKAECHPGWAYPAQFGYESWVCESASGELGTGQTTDGLREAPGSFASTGGREPQATPPDARVRPGARRASRDLGTAAAGQAFTREGTGDHRPVR